MNNLAENPSQAVEVYQGRRPLTITEIKNQVSKLREVLKQVLVDKVDYGVIPGTQKPSLLKPGSEKILAVFRIACMPIATDLSTEDVIRYRVEARGISIETGAYLGSGIGECSSDEEKYKWRKAVCEDEYLETPSDRKREKWAKGKDRSVYKIKQVRTHPADLANTILKMAKKRAQIDMCLSCTAASDVFTQDVEDLPREYLDQQPTEPSKSYSQPQRKSTNLNHNQSSDTISDAQRKRLYAICKVAGITDDQMKDFLMREYGVESSTQIKKQDYEAICEWVQGEPGSNG